VWTSTGGAGGTFTLQATLGANVAAYSQTGLRDGAEYCYRVRAVGPKGQASEFTSIACATTPVPTSPPPAAPTGLTVAVSAATTIALAWTDHATDEHGFEIWRSTTGPTGVDAPVASVGVHGTGADASGLTGGTQYCYQVRALGGGNAPPSDFSNTSCATAPAAPAAPSGLAASITSSTALRLTWNDNSADEQGLEVWRSTTGPSGTYSLLASVGANVTTRNNTGLAPDHEYCYQVRAVGAGFAPQSEFSPSACATPITLPPSSVQAAATTPTRINVTWQDDTPDEAGFEVWRSTTGIGGAYSLRSTRAAGVETFSDTGLDSATEYCYKVRATGTGGADDSPFAGPVCATTPLLVRLVLFGDSNTDLCADHQDDPLDPLRFGSYVSSKPALGPTAQHLSCSVAFKVDSAWSAMRPESVLVVNHGIGGTTTGGLGGTGDPVRSTKSAPNARALVGTTTRFQAEVLGVHAPTWNGGETNTTWYPSGPVTRVNAYVPRTNDFAYVSMGTNDDSRIDRNLSASATAANLEWMIQGWISAGHQANHFMLTTLAPRTDGTLNSATAIPDRNDLIKGLASTYGIHLIDLAAHVSDDDGLTWSSASFHIGDGVHYAEPVRAWLGGQIASWISAQAPPLP
jgi:hypothetical protein